MKSLSLTLTLILTLSYLLPTHQQAIDLSLTSTSPCWTRITYMFIHANPAHLIINLFSLLSLVFLANARLTQFLLSALISTTIPAAIIADTPTCGISALNFALTGIIVMHSPRWPRFMIINIIFIIPTYFMPHIASSIHLYALIAGALITYITTPRFNE